MAESLFYCNTCHNNKRVSKLNDKYSDIYGIVYFEFTIKDLIAKHNGTYVPLPQDICPECGEHITPMNITPAEWRIIQKTTFDADVLLALDKLKADDPIEFALKMAQFKQTAETIKQTEIAEKEQKSSLAALKASQKNADKPKCPTCGSTNVKKISGTKRWVGTGLFGLASSDLGKTMQCNSCGYKW